MTKYPNTVPVIMCAAKGLTLSKTKFIVPNHTKFGTLVLHARDHLLELSAADAIFLFVGEGVALPVSVYMEHAYERFRDEDGFLYVYVTKENTFGA